MKLGPLHHIGCVVPSLETARRAFAERFGGAIMGEPIELEDGAARIGFVQMPGVLMEFIEPVASGTDLTDFLAAHPGGGQHHFCHQVEDIAATLRACQDEGAELVSPIMTGVLGLPILFARLPDAPGLLVEFIEIRPE